MTFSRLWRFIPAVLWMAMIFILSSRSGDELGSLLPLFQHLLPGLESFDPMHYAAYFGLALTLAFGFGRFSFTWKGAACIVLLCVLYGITDEWHQSFVPNRSPDVFDLRNDAIGASVACLLTLGYGRLRRRSIS